MALITFADKVDAKVSTAPIINKIVADDINQLKAGVNANETAGSSTYKGVYSITVSNSASIVVLFNDILPNGITPNSSSTIIFFSNFTGLIIKSCILVDSNSSGSDDSFQIDFAASTTGNISISYFISIN